MLTLPAIGPTWPGLFFLLPMCGPVNSGKLFLWCMTGPTETRYNLCTAWNDWDGDGDVDLRDYAELQNVGMR